MKSFLPVFRVLGVTIMVFAVAMLIPLVASLVLDDTAASVYILSMDVTFATGALVWLLTRGDRSELQRHHGVLVVCLAWSVLPLFATLPLLLYFQSAGTPMSFTDAYFESVSGITTTGATVLSGLDALPPSINLWRCLLQWIGGGGILVFMVAILPLVGLGGSELFRAEASGPMKDTRLTPRMAETAKGLWTVYFGVSVACFLAYWLAGMPVLDAAMHMLSTVSSGGFSSHDASFGHFNSPRLEWIAIFFMIFTSCSYAAYFGAIYHRDARQLGWDAQFRGTVAVMLVAGGLVSVLLLVKGTYTDWEVAVRMAFFHVASIASTTGYATTDYMQWPVFFPILLLLLAGMASSAGSTGAGLKMIRVIIVFKQALREMTRTLHPRAVNPVKVGRDPVGVDVLSSILGFMLIYGVTILVMTLLLLLSDMQFDTAVGAVLATVNTTGPGLNELGPAGNFQGLTDYQKWVLVVCMLLGRVELLPFMLLLTKSFWRR